MDTIKMDTIKMDTIKLLELINTYAEYKESSKQNEMLFYETENKRDELSYSSILVRAWIDIGEGYKQKQESFTKLAEETLTSIKELIGCTNTL